MISNEVQEVKAGTDGISFTVEWKPEEDPDLSFLGKFTDESKEWNISRAHNKFVHDLTKEEKWEADNWGRQREYGYFEPVGGGEKPSSKLFKKFAMQDYDRIKAYNQGEWCMYGCVVTAFFRGIEVGYASCWGYESDMGESEANQVEKELISEARIQARTKLAELKEFLK
jgi:hypothetical protein